MNENIEDQILKALNFFTEGHHCDAYDDPAAAQHYGIILASALRYARGELAALTMKVEAMNLSGAREIPSAMELLERAETAEFRVKELERELRRAEGRR